MENTKQTKSEALLTEGLNKLGLTKALVELLNSNGVNTVGDLQNKTKSEILAMPRIGEKRLEAIESALELKKLKLKEEEATEVKEEKEVSAPKVEKVEKPKKAEKVVEAKKAEKVEETKEAAEEDYEDVDPEDNPEEDDEIEEEEKAEESAETYRTLQVVIGTVKEVQESRTIRGDVKPERVLIELEDGQDGFLFRNDTEGIRDDEELFDLFFEGDQVKVVIKKIFPNNGKFIFSTVLLKMKDDLHKYEEDLKGPNILTAHVVRKLKNGYLLRHNDFTCLLPETQVLKTEEDLVGKDIEVAPIRIDYGRIRLIVSQTVAYSITSREERKKIIESINVGDEFEGTVKNIESYGAFVEIAEGVEGLLHISELEHYRVFKVEKVVQTGDKVKVKVIKIDGEHVGLSRKALIPNYWNEWIADKKEGSVVNGKITEINNAGIVLEVSQDVTAFLPRSEYAYERDVNLKEEVNIGDELEAKIIEIDASKKRIILSRKQQMENPWETTTLSVGDFIEVEVQKELKGGYKIKYQEINGYLPKGNRDNQKDLEIGKVVKARVRVFEPDKTRLIVHTRSEQQPRREVYGKFVNEPQEKLTSSFGDLLEQLKNKK